MKKIPFLTISENIGFRDTLHRGHSKMSGDYVVEEVNGDAGDGERNRRLVFLSNVGAIQSEARVSVKRIKNGDKRGKKNSSKVRRNLVERKFQNQFWIMTF